MDEPGQGNCIWISLDRPNALGRLVSNRVLRNCVSLRPYQARRVEHSFHLRHQREALAAKNFKCDCPGFGSDLIAVWTRLAHHLNSASDPPTAWGKISGDDRNR